MRTFVIGIAIFALAGCEVTNSPPGTVAEKPISWAEYQQMSAEEQAHQSIIDKLDDEAKKKLAESQRKKKR